MIIPYILKLLNVRYKILSCGGKGNNLFLIYFKNLSKFLHLEQLISKYVSVPISKFRMQM